MIESAAGLVGKCTKERGKNKVAIRSVKVALLLRSDRRHYDSRSSTGTKTQIVAALTLHRQDIPRNLEVI